ncbi:hypothetical protein TEA_019799 [Camellia sinensis var. sinensis]|uniref:Strictosidine synthase conserved region domain-containing protein n=1 Tax=Camellia sinensis var. sinensis TaxID=542762 RepID=A0A4S4DTI2_CAMSN|nr:hypothetical protein TEA_019799 [Camellia sinensis var. sinensis]
MASKLFIFIFFSSLPFVVLSQSFSTIQLPQNVRAPVSLTFDPLGKALYVAVSDGRILWLNSKFGFTDFAYTAPTRTKQLCDGTTNPDLGPVCGKPYSLSFSRRGDLYIVDAYFGLLVVGRNGGFATQLATSAEGVPFRFLTALDVDLLTEIPGVPPDATGRFMKYDPRTRQVTVLLRGLSRPSGVAVSLDRSFVLVSENSANRILKYWLRGRKANTAEILISLPAAPNQIKRNPVGDFWVPIRAVANQQPTSVIMPIGLKINRFGVVLASISFSAQYYNVSVSVALELNHALYTGSSFNAVDFVGAYTI